jgi:hypothetical protein
MTNIMSEYIASVQGPLWKKIDKAAPDLPLAVVARQLQAIQHEDTSFFPAANDMRTGPIYPSHPPIAPNAYWGGAY